MPVGPQSARPPTDFTRLVQPRGIALVGASSNPMTVGGQPLRFLTEFGYAGRVYPVNPKYGEMKGLACYPDLTAVPEPCDLALIVVNAQHVPAAIRQCGARGIPFAIVLTAGFREIGEAGTAPQAELDAAIAASGVRVMGPNCIGLLNLVDHIHAGFGGAMSKRDLRAGSIAMVTQSGGYGMGVVAAADAQGVGFNFVLSTGNETDITATELLRYLIERDDVRAVLAFMEGSTDGRGLNEIGRRALALEKPVLMWKVGNSRAGRRAAVSHTGRLTAGPELFRRAMNEGGFIEVGDTDDVVDLAQFLAMKRHAAGTRAAVLTLSGGAGVLTSDLLEQNGFEVPETSPETLAKLKPNASALGSLANPFDLTPQGYTDSFAGFTRVIETVLASPEFDLAVIRSAPGAVANVWSHGFVDVVEKSGKPVVVTWGSGAERTGEAYETIQGAGIPSFVSPRRAVNALGAMHRFHEKAARWRARSSRGWRRPVEPQTLELPAVAGALGERESKRALARYGVPVVRERAIALDAIARLASIDLPFPVVVKIDSPDIAHKTEVGGVRVGVPDLSALRQAAQEIVSACRAHAPRARIDGVLVQEMATGTEVIVGAVDDPYFGPTVLCGLGGILTELLHDVTHRFAPFDHDTAREMLAELRAAPIFAGYRGGPALDVEALADALVRVSLLIADHCGHVREIDVNPLFVRAKGEGVIAADALVVLRGAAEA